MEPIFLEPVYKDYIWGGTNLKKLYERKTTLEKVAESWEISAHQNGSSIIKNGEYKNMTLTELFDNKKLRVEIFGTNCVSLDKFPILNKFIDATDKLSIQVHPDNDYAHLYENSLGKTEMWYVVSAKDNAKLVYGTKGNITKEEFIKANDNGTIEETLNYADVKKGDVIYLPAGTVHAILDGLIIYEIQQNSDITYRVYDWNRLDKKGSPRELHVKKAIDVINFDFKGKIRSTNDITKEIIANKYFKVDKIYLKEKYSDNSDNISFHAYTVIEGTGILNCNEKEYELKPGMSFIIPAILGKFEIESANMELIRTSIV